jgi:hypothetical protein
LFIFKKFVRMKNQILLLSVALLFITSCSKTNDKTLVQSQVNTPRSAGKAARTISGSIHYTYTTDFDLPCDCGAQVSAGNYVGTGTLTHLGMSSSKIKPCLSPLYSGASMIGQHVGTECNTLAGADGDELYCNILPYDILFAGADAIGVINIDIIGGTGKFAGATGHFSGTATVHLSLGTADLEGINGTIDY